MRMDHTVSAKPSIARLDVFGLLGIATGIIMPVLAALIYPVYMHQMQPAWAEWTRLMELPFVACELVIVQFAVRKGYRDRLIWKYLPRDVKIAFGLLFVGLTVSSVLFSKNTAASVTLSLTTLVHLRFCGATFFLVRSDRNADIRTFFPLLGLGLAALTILTIWKFKMPPPELTVPGGKIEWPSALPGFISVRHFGSWTGAIAAGFLLVVLYGDKEQSQRMAPLYLFAVGLTFWSGTRAAVLGLAVVALTAAVSLRRLPNAAALLRTGGLSALAMLGAVVFSPGLPEFKLFVQDDIQSADAMATGRFELWHDTFFRWLASPIFGWGSGSTFWEVNIGGWTHTQPHNTILLFLISWGVVGAVGGLWLLIRAIVATHRTGMDDARLRPFTGMLYSLLFMSLLEGMLYYPRFIMLVMIIFAVLFAARERQVKELLGHSLDD
jgi:exopolysaccharide production protein ExoQ